MGFNLKDAALKLTKALPNGAATIYTSGLDLGNGANGDFLADMELLISLPALVVGELANGATMKAFVQHDDDSAFGTVATIMADVVVQTGAGGAGAAAASARVRLPVDVKRYVRVGVVNSGAGDCHAKSVTVEPVF